MKESKSRESCHLSEEEDAFDAEGVQVKHFKGGGASKTF